jgi:flagellar hook-basal body complex protein FliE
MDIRVASVGGVAAAAPRVATRAAGAGGEGFAQALGEALDQVNALQLEAEQTATTLASGKPVDMTQAVVTLEKASVSLQFAIQVRNKLLEAYQEIMRMQV